MCCQMAPQLFWGGPLGKNMVLVVEVMVKFIYWFQADLHNLLHPSSQKIFHFQIFTEIFFHAISSSNCNVMQMQLVIIN